MNSSSFLMLLGPRLPPHVPATNRGALSRKSPPPPPPPTKFNIFCRVISSWAVIMTAAAVSGSHDSSLGTRCAAAAAAAVAAAAVVTASSGQDNDRRFGRRFGVASRRHRGAARASKNSEEALAAVGELWQAQEGASACGDMKIRSDRRPVMRVIHMATATSHATRHTSRVSGAGLLTMLCSNKNNDGLGLRPVAMQSESEAVTRV